MPPPNPKPAREKPAHELRLGAVKAAIWRNETDSGARYNTSLCRIYKDGEEWKTAESFGRDDLLFLAKVADQAHTWICDQQTQEYDRNRTGR